jgi:hypothetical protein
MNRRHAFHNPQAERLRVRASAQTRELNQAGRRAEWRELADKARAAAGLAAAAVDATFARDFAHLTARAERSAPPLESDCDRMAAEALRLLCLAWTRRDPVQRPALADAVGAAARLVDQLLTDEQVRAAQVWMRQSGGGD